MLFELTFLFFYGDAGPVADELICARQRVEQRCLAAVRVAREGNGHFHSCSSIHFDFMLAFANHRSGSSPSAHDIDAPLYRRIITADYSKGALPVGSADFNHRSVSFADRKLIAANGDFHRIA